jgi:hypothetical protein
MNKGNWHRHAGYQKGFNDGKRTGGKINKRYVEDLLKTETQDLLNEEALDYKTGWQDGFTDAVNRVIKSMVLQEEGTIPIQHLVIHV